MFTIIFSKQASNSIKNLPKANKEKFKEILTELSINPFSYPYKKIQGEINTYRIRLGQFRILYELDKEILVITILKIENRKKAYK